VGFLPFEAEDERELFSLIRAGDVTYDDPAWDVVSPTAQKLVAALLVVAPEHRLRAREAAAHPWFAAALEGAAPLDTAQQKLRSDVARRRFQKTVKALQVVGRMARMSRTSASSATAEHGTAESKTDSTV
jgi:serine/threonine protein kinase